jgi:hypothetical protein
VPLVYTNSWVNGPAQSGFIIIFADLLTLLHNRY